MIFLQCMTKRATQTGARTKYQPTTMSRRKSRGVAQEYFTATFSNRFERTKICNYTLDDRQWHNKAQRWRCQCWSFAEKERGRESEHLQSTHHTEKALTWRSRDVSSQIMSSKSYAVLEWFQQTSTINGLKVFHFRFCLHLSRPPQENE